MEPDVPGLFDPITLRDLTLRNRIGMSPMCQYEAQGDGVPTDWHRAHYRSRAVGGTGLVIAEMTNVEARGRITEGCLGLWNDAQRDAFARVADDVHAEGAAFAIQIAHAGRKSTVPGTPIAPSAVPFAPERAKPLAATASDIALLVEAFASAARRAVQAGVDAIELHGAHGYLLHQFFSSLSNQRDDAFADPVAFPLRVVEAVRAEMPSGMPLLLRISLREHQPGGYGRERWLGHLSTMQEAGVDLIDVSTGGNGPVRPPDFPGYQLDDAAAVRDATGMPVAAVGMLHDPALAEYAVRSQKTDLVLVGRGMLSHPYWAHEAARELGVDHRLPGEYAQGLR